MPKQLTLSASEMLSLWNVYLTETMTLHVTKYFLSKVEDQQISQMLEFALRFSQESVEMATKFFTEADHPLPEGFTEEDVNMDVPNLFSDEYVILLKDKLVQDALVVCTMALGTATRPDLRAFFERQLVHGAKLENMILNLEVKKGLHRPIQIPVPEQIEKVKSSFFYLSGIFEKNRPLSTAEIFNLELNFRATEVVSIFFKACAQLDSVKEAHLTQHFIRGSEIMDKHVQIFQARLTDSGLPQLPTWESEIRATRVAPFSVRVMLFKSAIMLSATAGRYGVALSTVLRADVGSDFMRLMMETLKYGEDTLNLMIKKGYFDQHPFAK